MRGVDERVRFVHAADGYRLAVTELSPRVVIDGPRSLPVLLVHGFAQNRLAFSLGALPHALHRVGARVFLGELRGHGLSKDPHHRPADWDLRVHLERDLPALCAHVLEQTGARRLHYMGHSMGGILGYAALAARPPFATLTGWAAPVWLGAGRPVVRLAALAVSPALGFRPPHVPMDRFLGTLSRTLADPEARGPSWAFQRYTGISNPHQASPRDLEAILSGADRESPRVFGELAKMSLTRRPRICGVDLIAAIRGWRRPLAAVVGEWDIFANPKTVRPLEVGAHEGPRAVLRIPQGTHVDVTMGHHVPDTVEELWRFLSVDSGAEHA